MPNTTAPIASSIPEAHIDESRPKDRPHDPDFPSRLPIRVRRPCGPAVTPSRERPDGTQPVDLKARLTYPFSVPLLPYGYDANEPSIDAQTMRLHHDKHHAAYVSNLNAALKDHADLHDLPLQDLLARSSDLPDAIRTVVRNNAGGHANHTMFWQVMGGQGGTPDGELGAAIARDFGSLDALKAGFTKAATGVFGSGWAMVLVDPEGRLTLQARPNQDSPLMESHAVLFGNDVWEHAYYLRYQNRRPDYLAAWWTADSDEAGRVFRFQAGQHSNMKPATVPI